MTLWDFTRQLINTQLLPYAHKIIIVENNRTIFDGICADIYYDEDNAKGLFNRWGNDIKTVYADDDTIHIVIKEW